MNGENTFCSKNAETKREEFRKYLESNGILDALTKVLVGLYEEPEKPMDPLEYPFYHHTLFNLHLKSLCISTLYRCQNIFFLLMFVSDMFYNQPCWWNRLLESFFNFNLKFVKRHLHGGPPDVVDTDALQQRIRELEEQNKKLESELALVKQQVIFYSDNR